MRGYKRSKLETMSRVYETNTNVLAKLKDMYKKERYSYFAGTLAVNTPDLVQNEGYVYIDVRPINTCSDTLEREIQYWVSKMFKKFKSKTSCFHKLALENIEDYEGKI